MRMEPKAIKLVEMVNMTSEKLLQIRFMCMGLAGMTVFVLLHLCGRRRDLHPFDHDSGQFGQ